MDQTNHVASIGSQLIGANQSSDLFRSSFLEVATVKKKHILTYFHFTVYLVKIHLVLCKLEFFIVSTFNEFFVYFMCALILGMGWPGNSAQVCII